MTYEIEIELADVIGIDSGFILSEIEAAVETAIYAVLNHREKIDIGRLLEPHRAIAQVWDTSHVRDQRPDLTDEQAWEVLRECDRSWDRLNDPMRAMIRRVAENRFPNPRGKAALRATLKRIERQIEALPENEGADPAAYGSVAAALDAMASSVEGARP